MENRQSKNFINKGFLLAHLLVITTGAIQFGWSLGSWNVVTKPYADYNNWGDQLTSKQTIV